MSWYRRVDTRVWNDAKFESLSLRGQLLWFRLLTGPETTNLPGVFPIGKLALAEAMGWLPEDLEEPFREVFAKGMAKADWKARLIWLPNAAKYNPPSSPNVVKSWCKNWDSLPDCPIKYEIYASIQDSTKDLGEGFQKAFADTFAKTYRNPFERPTEIEEKRRDKEREGERVRAPEVDQAQDLASPLSPIARNHFADIYLVLANEIAGTWTFAHRGERNQVGDIVDAYRPKPATSSHVERWLKETLLAWRRRDPNGSEALSPMKLTDWLRAACPDKTQPRPFLKAVPDVAQRPMPPYYDPKTDDF